MEEKNILILEKFFEYSNKKVGRGEPYSKAFEKSEF